LFLTLLLLPCRSHACDVQDVCNIMPAAGQITDLPRFVAALTKVGLTGGLGQYFDPPVLESLLDSGVRPVMLQLSSADWLQIIQGGGDITEEILQVPAVQQMTADQVGQLLQRSAESWASGAVMLLATLPAAQQLAPDVVSKLLLTLLRPQPGEPHVYSCDAAWLEAWEALLRLPPAQLISEGVLQQIIDRAAEGGCGRAICSLQCLLPQAAELQCGLSSEQLVCSILGAFKGERGLGGEDVKVLVQQAGMQALCAQDLASLSVQVLRLPSSRGSYDREVGDVEIRGEGGSYTVPCWAYLMYALLQLPAAQQLSSTHVTQLIQGFVLRLEAAGESISSGELDLLPAAHEISAGQLLQMLTELSQRLKEASVWDVLQQLQQLPAWNMLSAAELLRVVKMCLGQHLAKYRASSALCTQLSEVLLQHPASGQLPGAGMVDLLIDSLGWRGRSAALFEVVLQHPAAAAAIDAEIVCKLLHKVLSECAKPTSSVDFMAVLLQLPADQKLSAQQVSALVHQALHKQEAGCCQLLSTHPAVASGADPELQLLLEVVQPRGFSMGAHAGPPQLLSYRLCGCPRCTELADAEP
jgi:hypothetical protein